MPEGFNSELAREDRREQVAKLYARGYTQRQIASVLGVTQPCVCYDLQAIRAEWLESRVSSYQETVSEELAKLAEVETEAWAAWERSKLNAETREVGENDKGSFSKDKTVGQYGDPRLLATVLDCVKQRRAILGLDAPTKIKMTDADVDQFIVEELARLAAIPVQAIPFAGGGEGLDLGSTSPHSPGESNGHHSNGSAE